MSNYAQIVSYGPKDALSPGDPNKRILGTQIDAELAAISTAITSKEDTANKNIANGYAGLDAGALLPDARLSTNIPRLSTVNTFLGNQTVSNTLPAWVLDETDAGANQRYWLLRSSGGTYAISTATDAAPATAVANAIAITRSGTTVTAIDLGATTVNINGGTVWHSGNDGSGSGLDADLLDGSSSAAFAAASHTHATSDITSGTFADARIAQSNVTQHQAALAINTERTNTDYITDSGTSRTVGNNDVEAIVRFTSGSTITVTLGTPGGNWLAGHSVVFIRGGAGAVNFTGGTIRSSGGTSISVANGKVCATYEGSGVWELSGNL